LGFERKARLFCDDNFKNIFHDSLLLSLRLGFERKARLFCDSLTVQVVLLLVLL